MDKNRNMMTFALYVGALVLVLYFNDPLFTIFLWLVLMSYHFIIYFYIKDTLLEDVEEEKSRLMYSLKQKKKESSEVTKKFVSLANVIDSGLILIDDKEVIQQVNDPFKILFGVDDITQQNFSVLKSYKHLYNVLNEAYIQEAKVRKQIEFNNSYLDISISPIFEDDNFQGCLAIITDLTLLKTAETFQKQFTADVSHELKTPLSAIKGISEILDNNKSMDVKEREDFIEMIRHESSRLETILNDLLIISKMDRLDYELSKTNTSITQLTNEAVKLLKTMAQEKGLELEVNVEPSDLFIDATKMRQVLINLIKNAISYSDHGHINIQGNKKGSTYILSVKDTGIGISKEEQEKVFKRFYRVDEARSRASGGSGLGLSIIKNVVLKHGGTINLKSEAGVGSTFTISLPLNSKTI